MQDLLAIGAEIARARLEGKTLTSINLDALTLEDAEAAQSFALAEFDSDYKGHALVSLRTVGLDDDRPIAAPIAARALYRSGESIRLPEGTIGAQGQLAVTLGGISTCGEQPSALSVAVGITILGRRLNSRPLTRSGAIADFGLHVATVVAPARFDLDIANLGQMRVSMRLDESDMLVGKFNTSDLTATFDAVSGRGHLFAPGQIACFGITLPLLQILPGQHLQFAVESIGDVDCNLI